MTYWKLIGTVHVTVAVKIGATTQAAWDSAVASLGGTDAPFISINSFGIDGSYTMKSEKKAIVDANPRASLPPGQRRAQVARRKSATRRK